MPKDQSEELAGGYEYAAGLHDSECTENENTPVTEVSVTSVLKTGQASSLSFLIVSH